jgi:hypothetical protein
MSTPLGTLGAILPLGIVLAYMSAIDLSVGGGAQFSWGQIHQV